MKTLSKGLIRNVMICALLAGIAFASQAQATVLRVIVVKTDNTSAYLKELAKLPAITKRLQLHGTLRAWRARYAGHDAGAVVVSIEYPSLLVFAQDGIKMDADPEYTALLSGLDKVRTIVSDSLYDELKP